jgi:hypothetical protein
LPEMCMLYFPLNDRTHLHIKQPFFHEGWAAMKPNNSLAWLGFLLTKVSS